MATHDQESISLKFYQTLHGYITDYGVSDEEMQDIQAAVEETVGKFAEIVANIEPMFKAKSIHGVGSFYERTKILKLDEFDFSYVIDELSDETRVEVEKVFTEDLLGLTVKVKDKQYFVNSKWFVDTDTSENNDGTSYLGMMNFLPPKAVFYVRDKKKTFCDVLSKASEMIRSESLICSKPTGTLTLLGQENKVGPNIELWFEWKPKLGETFVIKSDITPVIRMNNVSEMITPDQCEHPSYLSRLYQKGSYFVMPSKFRHMQVPLTFSPTFTETERDIMADLDPCHRIAYQCLKFLLLDIYTRRNPLYHVLHQYATPWVWQDLDFSQVLKKIDYLTCKSFLSSYCLKTAVLRHCSNCERRGRPDLCGQDIVGSLLKCTKQEVPTLNGIFVKQDNLLYKFTQSDKAKDLSLLEKVLDMLIYFHEKKLTELSYDPDKSPHDNFRTMFSVLVSMSEENGLQEEDELLEFNPMKSTTGFVYNTYNFTRDTNSLLEDMTMDTENRNIMLDNAKQFYQFDMSLASAHSTITSSAMENDLQTIKDQLISQSHPLPLDKNEVTDKSEEEVVITDQDVTVLYSRI